MRHRRQRRLLAGMAAGMLALLLGAGFPAAEALAASGSVYTCTINRSYSHPVTGAIEDSGGEASYATGQGMVEGAVYSTGMLEVADTGAYYLTMRFSLVDYTSNYTFYVQDVGDSGWMSTAYTVTGQGTDSNGTTADVCIQVSSENCIVRCSMYVDPMGREVIYYLYPNGYSAGNSTGMAQTMVTEEASDTGSDSSTDSSGSTTSADTEDSDTEDSGTEDSGTDGTDSLLESDGLQSAGTAEEAGESGDSELDAAQGLSLSTADEATEEDGEGTGSGGQDILTLTASITLSGLILLGVSAGLVYVFRKNWSRWGGAEDDDEDEE